MIIKRELYLNQLLAKNGTGKLYDTIKRRGIEFYINISYSYTLMPLSSAIKEGRVL